MTEVRLAELVAALSLGVDLGFGQPMEHVLRESMIALRLADRIGLEETDRSTVYYTGLLVGVGCHADAHEQAKWFGDDIALKSTKYDHDFRSVRAAAVDDEPRRERQSAAASLPGRARVRRLRPPRSRRDGRPARGRGDRPGRAAGPAARRCRRRSAPRTSSGTARVGPAVSRAIGSRSRRAWRSSRSSSRSRTGWAATDAALELAEKRSGLQFDPALSAALRADPDGILDGLDSAHTWSAVIDAEPALRVTLSGDEFDRALLAIADFVDLKSPYTLGHARAVAELAAAAGEQLGLPQDEIRLLRRAGLVHDLGRLGVSNAIWDKPGPLGVRASGSGCGSTRI